MNWSTRELSKLEKELKTDFNSGLSAKKVAYGKNIILSKKKAGFFRLLFMQMTDFMTAVLLSAAAVSYFSTRLHGETDIFEPLLILAIVLLNALLGVFQQQKAERAIDALKKLSASSAEVLRDGIRQSISSNDLNTGDIVFVKAGDKISADMRIISSSALEADEASLTGESGSCEKESCDLTEPFPLAEQKNMLFSGTVITSGNAKAVVCAVSMNTEIGKIADYILSEEDSTTPLQAKLAHLGKTLGLSALVICAAIFAIGLCKHLPPLDMFITAVSLAVAAIPEGLPATVTVMLAIGVERMAKKNAIVKKLSAVETLGSATVICTDKTGTLTENSMTVSDFYSENNSFMRELAPLVSNIGASPTDNAVYAFGSFSEKYLRIDEKPFDSKRKMMSVLVKKGNSKLAVTKGGAEIVLSKCTEKLTSLAEEPLSPKERSSLIHRAEQMAQRGLRVLCIAYKRCDTIIENELVFCGLVGLSDPLRKEAKSAVEECGKAGIKVVMITGDHHLTAKAIARESGILKNGDRTLTGKELDTLTDSELDKILPNVSVFSRVTPEQKLRIIKSYKSKGHIVAMTGDGVNDAPALKSADIGCSMGKNGTDVAKEASDIILADDNFATIVSAVCEGRRIFANIRKSVYFLLSSNIGELLCVFFGLLFGWAAPLTPPQLLWINLVTDSLPAIALGLDPADRDVMSSHRKNENSLFTPASWLSIILEGAMIGALALSAYTVGAIYFGGSHPIQTGRTMAFIVLAVSQLVHAFNLRSNTSVLKALFKNRFLVLSFIIGLLLTLLLVNIPPVSLLFGVCGLSPVAWLVVSVFSAMPLFIVELAKFCEKATIKEHFCEK